MLKNQYQEKRSFKELAHRLTSCHKCRSLTKCRRIVVPGHGDKSASFMFIGLAPGRNGADITGVPFTRDPSGILFQEALIASGFSLEDDPRCENPVLRDAYITNLVKCNPKDEKGNNRTPSDEEIGNCLEFLRIEKTSIAPKVVVTLGKKVSECMLNSEIDRFREAHNKPNRRDDAVYVPFIHPSYVIRGAYPKEKYLVDFLSIRRII
jgi:uracil-DNA glycosylase family 4